MTIAHVDAPTLKRWMDNGEAVVVDVREPAEYHSEHIADASLVPLSAVTKAAMPNASGKKLVIHCRKGGRGEAACQKLLSEDGGLEVYNLEGGLTAWAQANFPVVRSGRSCLPLDRQVQLVIGVCVLSGSILAYTVSPAFLLLTGFFGLGLTFAGLTGFCGLAMIMAKMPWNQVGNQPEHQGTPKSCCSK